MTFSCSRKDGVGGVHRPAAAPLPLEGTDAGSTGPADARRPGTYDASYTVTDSDGASTTVTFTVTVD